MICGCCNSLHPSAFIDLPLRFGKLLFKPASRVRHAIFASMGKMRLGNSLPISPISIVYMLIVWKIRQAVPQSQHKDRQHPTQVHTDKTRIGEQLAHPLTPPLQLSRLEQTQTDRQTDQIDRQTDGMSHRCIQTQAMLTGLPDYSQPGRQTDRSLPFGALRLLATIPETRTGAAWRCRRSRACGRPPPRPRTCIQQTSFYHAPLSLQQ